MTELSICIPTYNFGRFIGKTLDSILPQIEGRNVEVIVFDGGSKDETETVVKKYQQQTASLQLRYIKQNTRGGIDKDIEAAVSSASGRYCWLFSADDIMAPGAVEKVLHALSSDYDLYLCEHDSRTAILGKIGDYPLFIHEVASGKIFDFGNSADCDEYFSLARTSEAFFSFLSTPIFKKVLWDAAMIPDSFYGTHWIVAGHLLYGMKHGMKAVYLKEILLSKRGENDSFLDHGVVERQRITIESFQHVSDNILGKTSREAFHIRRVLHRDVPLRGLLSAKLKAFQNPSLESRQILDRVAKENYIDPGIINWIKLSIYQLTPISILILGYWFRRKFLKKNG
jgi:abequosyltransferase